MSHSQVHASCFKGAFSGLRQLLATESPWKMMKNTYFTLKLFSFSRYISFFLHFLVMYKNALIKKMRLNQKFMTSQPVTINCNIHIAQYLKKLRQSDKDIWSINRTQSFIQFQLYANLGLSKYSEIMLETVCFYVI